MILVILSFLFVFILILALRNRVKTPDETFGPLQITDFYVEKTVPDYDAIFREEYTISPGEKKSIANVTITITGEFTPSNKTIFDRGKDATTEIEFIVVKSDGTPVHTFTFPRTSSEFTALSFANPRIVKSYTPDPDTYADLINQELEARVKINGIVDPFFSNNKLLIKIEPKDLSERDLTDINITDNLITIKFLALKISDSGVEKNIKYSKFRFVPPDDVTRAQPGDWDSYLCQTDFIINNVPGTQRFTMRVETTPGSTPQWVTDIGPVAKNVNTIVGAMGNAGYQLSDDPNQAAQFELIKNDFSKANLTVAAASKHLMMYRKTSTGYETTPLIITQTTKFPRSINQTAPSGGYEVIVRAVATTPDNLSVWLLYNLATFQLIPSTSANPKYIRHSQEPSSYDIKELWFECRDAEWQSYDYSEGEMILQQADRAFCDARPECMRCKPGTIYGLCYPLDEGKVICKAAESKQTPSGAAALYRGSQ